MVILDPMTLSSNPLEPFEKVLKRQNPINIGESIKMEAYSGGEHPHSLGDPWKGAYSRHGFWYKFHWGTEEDFHKLVAFSESQNDLLLQYEIYEPLMEKLRGKVLVAKTLSGDMMGGITLRSHQNQSIIGSHFVLEEYRHSGIGEKLLREILEHVPSGNNVVCNSVHPLHHSLPRFGLILFPDSPRIHRYILENPNCLMNLEEMPKDYKCQISTNLSEKQWKALFEFYVKTINQQIDEDFWRGFLTLSTTHCVVLFNEDEVLVAVCAVRKVAGGESIGNLVVGPLIAIDEISAERALRQALLRYHNSDEDYDFDPDPEAISRRSVNFFVPKSNDKMKNILAKLSGDQRKIEEKRIWYQAASFNHSTTFLSKQIFSTGDLNFFMI